MEDSVTKFIRAALKEEIVNLMMSRPERERQFLFGKISPDFDNEPESQLRQILALCHRTVEAEARRKQPTPTDGRAGE